MKGAIADPWVRIIRPPKIAKMIMVGKSQYFFLMLKKIKNSFINSILKLIFHTTL